jgi:hypothetical protein
MFVDDNLIVRSADAVSDSVPGGEDEAHADEGVEDDDHGAVGHNCLIPDSAITLAQGKAHRGYWRWRRASRTATAIIFVCAAICFPRSYSLSTVCQSAAAFASNLYLLHPFQIMDSRLRTSNVLHIDAPGYQPRPLRDLNV